MYPWATKEYLLWKMSLAQIVLYHNIGIEFKYPKPPPETKDAPSLRLLDRETRKEKIEEARRIWRETKAREEEARSAERKKSYNGYGDI